MSYWRSEYDDGWWTFYKDGIEIKLDNLNFGDLIVDEINNANQRIAELEEANEYWSKRALIGERWIPVSERLPECEKDVIVFWGKASDGSTLDWFGTAWRNECDDGKWCTDPVVPTHWMPLPEPPEGAWEMNDELNSILEQHRLWDCKIAKLEKEIARLQEKLHDEMSQLEIATDLGNKRWVALNEIYENAEKHNANWCKRKAQEGLGIKNA